MSYRTGGEKEHKKQLQQAVEQIQRMQELYERMQRDLEASHLFLWHILQNYPDQQYQFPKDGALPKGWFLKPEMVDGYPVLTAGIRPKPDYAILEALAASLIGTERDLRLALRDFGLDNYPAHEIAEYIMPFVFWNDSIWEETPKPNEQ